MTIFQSLVKFFIISKSKTNFDLIEKKFIEDNLFILIVKTYLH
jgi:hypothetical protein